VKDWRASARSADEAITHLRSGMNVFVQAAAATPTELLEALCRRPDLRDITLYHLHTEGPCPFADPDVSERVRSVSLFTGAAMRGPIREGRADFIPVFLKDIPGLFRSGTIRLDAALVHLSPPDGHGLCTLGTSVDAAMAAVDCAEIVIAQINPRMPRVHGYGFVPFAALTGFTAVDRPLHAHRPAPESEVTDRIGRTVAAMVEDGSTLQLGIGAIPDAVLRRLGDKNNLGLHTEMFSDGVIDLMESGVIDNSRKKVHRGRSVTSFVIGTQRLFDFVDDNTRVEFHPCDRTNDTALIRKNPAVVAVNSAISVDLTGQVCADSIGHQIFSGIGGQMDFMHGAALSPGGKPILALPSTARNGTMSRITAELAPGSGVVTTRGHVHYVVTEYGVTNLHGCTLRQRAEQLIEIAHPDFRSELRKQVVGLRHFTFGEGGP
jgi:acyl-CoA hydrolase